MSDEKTTQSLEIIERKIFEILKDTETLIIIDNIEEVLKRDEEKLKSFLQDILERLPHLKILTTSRESIGNLDGICENVFSLT